MYSCFTCTLALHVQLYVLHVDRFDQKSNPLLVCITCIFVLDLINSSISYVTQLIMRKGSIGVLEIRGELRKEE